MGTGGKLVGEGTSYVLLGAQNLTPTPQDDLPVHLRDEL